jgi:recombination protein RecA
MGVTKEIIKKSGSFFSYGDTRLGQGLQNASTFLADPEQSELRDELDRKVRAAYHLGEGVEDTSDILPSEEEIAELEAITED